MSLLRCRLPRGLLLLALLAWPAAAGVDAQQLTREQQAAFLKSARVVKATPIGKGVTKPFRLTLTDDTLTHDAAFQSVDEQKDQARTGRGGRTEFKFSDSWRFNVAAPRVADLLGIGDMVPVSIERSWQSKRGAFTWWVDDVLMDEQERRQAEAEPPDRTTWYQQQSRMHVFTQLVYDTDRNQGNILITKDWRLVMIDFTRAFRPWDETPSPLQVLRRCDRKLLDAMRTLTKPVLLEATARYLTTHEVDALLARRDAIVKHFETLIAKVGENAVLY
jgi:hypothetical protein